MAAPTPSAVYNFSLPSHYRENNFFALNFASPADGLFCNFNLSSGAVRKFARFILRFLIGLPATLQYVCTRNSASGHCKSAGAWSPWGIDKFSHVSSLTRGAAAGNRAVFRSGLELQEFSGVTARNAHCAAMARLPLLMTCLPDDRARKQSG